MIMTEDLQGKCRACGAPVRGYEMFCLVDLILVMKEAGFKNEFILELFRSSFVI